MAIIVVSKHQQKRHRANETQHRPRIQHTMNTASSLTRSLGISRRIWRGRLFTNSRQAASTGMPRRQDCRRLAFSPHGIASIQTCSYSSTGRQEEGLPQRIAGILHADMIHFSRVCVFFAFCFSSPASWDQDRLGYLRPSRRNRKDGRRTHWHALARCRTRKRH